ncbi:hypothetical protein H0W80_04150 [Candidatus Saccharibacteria bacterium]|nr:hypothetical protein [Candidatus Saccharibacteria bacterium]
MNKKTWQVSHSETSTANPKAIWARWTNVSDWPEEDTSLESAKLEGDFTVGTKIVMKPKGFPKSSVTITKVNLNKTYTTVGNIPMGKMTIVHVVDVQKGKTVFTHTITLTGPLRNVFAKLVAQKLADNLPSKMQNIASLAEKSK